MSTPNKVFNNFSNQKKVVSGEVFKEPFMDIFLTNLEQTAFSLELSKQKELFLRAIPEGVAKGNLSAFGSSREKSQDSLLSKKTNIKTTEFSKKNLEAKVGNQIPKKFILSESSDSGRRIPPDSTLTATEGIPPFTRKGGKGGLELGVKPAVKIASYVNCGDKIDDVFGKSAVVNKSGKIIKISKKQIVLQKTQVLLFYSEASVHVKQGDWVTRGAPILTLTNNTLITGDIVQGIPRIEQLFEAPNGPPSALRTGEYVYTSLHSQIREIFRKNWLTAPLPVAVRKTLQEMQQILIESIQKVYLSQGVLIADKHVEIVVSQMTNKAQIIDSGSTGLFLEEVLSLREIENANLATAGKKALYAPTVIGLTKSALHSDSFLSAASFQETSRVLSRDAVIGKSDFLRGLKEKVVVGDIISAGTGLDAYFVYTLLCNKQFSHLLKYPNLAANKNSHT